MINTWLSPVVFFKGDGVLEVIPYRNPITEASGLRKGKNSTNAWIKINWLKIN